jgi:hypothetical protein
MSREDVASGRGGARRLLANQFRVPSVGTRSQGDMDASILAAAEALQRLATAKHAPPPVCTPYVTARIWNGEREPLVCPVCRDAIPALEQLAVLCCGHHYHTDCARRLQSCAICRA